jgi:hypothetical protein
LAFITVSAVVYDTGTLERTDSMQLPEIPKAVRDLIPAWVPEPVANIGVYMIALIVFLVLIRITFALLDVAFASLVSLVMLSMIGIGVYWVYDNYVKPKAKKAEDNDVPE